MTSEERMFLSLNGLSVGDALGQRFFGSRTDALDAIGAKRIPAPPWTYTDDNEMALSIVQVLGWEGGIDADILARQFAKRYSSHRGYGANAHKLLRAYRDGAEWRTESSAAFGGSGSYGNGAAMRVAPLGAYCANDLDDVVANAQLSAIVTHAHPEGVAGAVAVAVATAEAALMRGRIRDGHVFIEDVIEAVPEGEVRRRMTQTLEFDFKTSPYLVAEAVGSGEEIAAYDTVPFCIWCAARHLGNYADAFWATVSGLGDRDTTCAIVGGIVAMSSEEPIPQEWLAAREPLPALA